jgi:hypothetical protein
MIASMAELASMAPTAGGQVCISLPSFLRNFVADLTKVPLGERICTTITGEASIIHCGLEFLAGLGVWYSLLRTILGLPG